MTEHRFRTLITLYVVVTVAAVVVGFLPGGYSDALRQAYENEPYAFADTSLVVLIPVLVLALGAIIAGVVGLYLLKSWGRSLSLWTTLMAIPLVAIAGPSLSSGLEAALWELSSVLWGAVLAVAYFSPVSAGFRANNSQPTPLRGAG